MIYFEKDLYQSENFFSYLNTEKKIALITDSKIEKIHLEKIKKMFLSKNILCEFFTFPHGEKSKNRSVKQSLEDQLFAKGFLRDTLIIAFGGGVTTDLAGYIAATFCRGVSYISVPTSLLAMVDASIGGKVGVNTSYGKNLIGAFYQPEAIFIDPSFINTLDMAEIKSGMVEVIKTALLGDKNFFYTLLENKEKILSLDLSFYEMIIKKAALIKERIVLEDEKDHGIRCVLNLGHTIGHAIENAASYFVPHGNCIAIGLCAEAYISNLLGILSDEEYLVIKQIFHHLEIPLKLNEGFCEKKLREALLYDKKVRDNKVCFSLLDKIAKPYRKDSKYAVEVDQKLQEKAINWTLKTCL